MKAKGYSKTEAQKNIDSFFQRALFTAAELRKIRRLAMTHRIRLGEYRKRFCQKCYSQLQDRLSLTKTHKTITCKSCGWKNKQKFIK